MKIFMALVCFQIGLVLASASLAESKNGFDLSGSSVPTHQIHQGGPPRDGIPSIDHPEFLSASDVHYLKAEDRVLGLSLNDHARAYPIRILNWHEIVNDQVDGAAVVITFCPLCGTGMAFDANVRGRKLSFGVSGLLYQSDVLLYDRYSSSLWSQIKREAVTGPYRGQQLKQLPLSHTTWDDWKKRYPETRVLSLNTGYPRDYSSSPYGGYETSARVIFDVNHRPPALYHPKEQVMGLKINGLAKAYPFQELSQNGLSSFDDKLGDKTFTVVWNAQARSAHILDLDSNEIPTTTAFWFAWYTFHPETEVFVAPQEGGVLSTSDSLLHE